MVNKLEIIQVAIEQLKRKEPMIVRTLIRQFVMENVHIPRKKIDVFDYANNRINPREIFGGVYMDKSSKVAVASDSSIMVVSKSQYKPTKFKNGIVTKDGKNISGQYVDYKGLFDRCVGGESFTVPADFILEKRIKEALVEEFLKCDDRYHASVQIYDKDVVDGMAVRFKLRAIPLLLGTQKTKWKFLKEHKSYYYDDGDLRIVVAGIYVDV